MSQTQPTIDLRIWICDLTYTQQAVSADLIPAAIGGIATFTEARLPLAQPIRLFKYPEKLAEALEAEGCPDVIGFSNYIWNANLSLAFARRIKEMSPATITVFGGPNFPAAPEESEEYLRRRDAIDFFIVKEGEAAFCTLMEKLAASSGDLAPVHGTVASVHSIDAAGRYHAPGYIDRIKDLTQIPSPYTSGRLDEFFDGRLLPIIQTNRGCPFTCTFCVEGVGYYSKVYRSAQEKVQAEIEYIGGRMAEVRAKGGRNDLFIADSNFGMYKEDIDTCRAIAAAQDRFGWPEYINVATGKNQKERVLEAARLIRGALRLSGSVQSLDAEVLANIKRNNIGSDDLMRLALDAADVGANSYCETILGLPGDSKDKHYNTLATVIAAGFNMVSTFQLMMLPGSEMCTRETREKFRMVTRRRVFPRCFGHYQVLGRKLISAEIEEVCVASDTLPFEDYLECRLMHLTIAVFHNDGSFGTILKYLRAAGLSVYRWLELLRDTPAPERLEALRRGFIDATRAELWDSEEELEEFIQRDGVIERYIDGDLGVNLLFTHKTMAMTQCTADLAAFVRECTLRLLDESGVTDPEVPAFVEDAAAYHEGRMTSLFSDETTPAARLRYDLARYDLEARPGPLADYRMDTPCEVRFVRTPDQRDLIDRYLTVFGNTPHGIGRMMTKVYVRKLFRVMVEAEAAA